MKFVLNLKNKKIPGIKKTTRIPGIDTVLSKKHGKMYRVKYFFDSGKGPHMFSFTSKDPGFKTLFSFDAYNMALEPTAGFMIKKDATEADVINMVSKIVPSTKYKMPKRKKIKEGEQVNEFISQLLQMVPDELKPMVYTFAILYGIIFAIPVILQLKNMLVGLYNWSHERYVSGPAENKVNKELFIGQAKNEPAFAVYDNLKAYIDYIIKKQANALIVCGPPGMSKTYTVRRTLHFAGMKPGRDYAMEKGASLGLLATYSLLFKNRKRLLILDDFDTPLMDQDIVNLLKSITDTYTKRIVSLPREKVMGTFDKGEKVIGVPEKFEFQGQLVIITNLTKDKIDQALLSRAPAFQVNYNTKEILASTQKMLKFINPTVDMKLKEEVYNYILKLYANDKNVNITFRAVKSAVDAKIGNPLGWKEMVKVIIQYKGKNIAERYLQHLNIS